MSCQLLWGGGGEFDINPFDFKSSPRKNGKAGKHLRARLNKQAGETGRGVGSFVGRWLTRF